MPLLLFDDTHDSWVLNKWCQCLWWQGIQQHSTAPTPTTTKSAMTLKQESRALLKKKFFASKNILFCLVTVRQMHRQQQRNSSALFLVFFSLFSDTQWIVWLAGYQQKVGHRTCICDQSCSQNAVVKFSIVLYLNKQAEWVTPFFSRTRLHHHHHHHQVVTRERVDDWADYQRAASASCLQSCVFSVFQRLLWTIIQLSSWHTNSRSAEDVCTALKAITAGLTVGDNVFLFAARNRLFYSSHMVHSPFSFHFPLTGNCKFWFDCSRPVDWKLRQSQLNCCRLLHTATMLSPRLCDPNHKTAERETVNQIKLQ